MKKTIFLYYLLFGIVFLIVYGLHNKKYETPQTAVSINFSKEELTNVTCTDAGRTWVYKFQRPDKSTYYLCSKEQYWSKTHMDEKHYISPFYRVLISFFVAIICVGILAFLLNQIE